MAAFRELQALETSDGTNHDFSLAAGVDDDNNSNNDDGFFEEFDHHGHTPYERHDSNGLTNTQWAEQLRNLSSSIVQPGSYTRRRFISTWGTRFDEFRKDILGHNTSKVFVSHELEQFILYYFRRYQPKPACTDSDDEEANEQGDIVEEVPIDSKPRVKWSYNTLKDVMTAVTQRASFRWNDFKLTPRQEMRAKGAIEQTLNDGYASKQECVSRDQALGVYFVRRMSRGMIQHALDGNLPSWDTAVMFTLAVVVQAALNCRLGDILAPNNAEEWPKEQTPSLTYDDVKLVLEGGTSIEDIKGEWTIRNAKGSNGEPSKAYRLNRNALVGNNDNSLCPVRLILANAMRHGNAKGGSTVQSILAQATTHPLNRIEWVDSSLPVFCHVTAAHTITRRQPMRTAHMDVAFRLFQDILDTNVTIRSHDIRYGAADDLLRVVRGDQLTIQDIGQELNHSAFSTAKGVTRKYTKKSSVQDTWQARVALPDQRSTFSNVLFNADPIQPRAGAKRTLNEVDDVMSSDGVDFVHRLTHGADLRQPIVMQLPPRSSQSNNTTNIHTRPRKGTYSTTGCFPCKEEGCCLVDGEAFNTLEYLQVHELKFHSKYLPAQCPIFGCKMAESLSTFEDLAIHIQAHLEPQTLKAHIACYVTCRVDGCTSSYPKASEKLYQKHLRDAHRISGAVVGRDERGDGTHLCLFPGCKHGERFPNGGHAAGAGAPYALHLADNHDLQSNNARAIYQLKMYVNASAWVNWILPILVQGSPTTPEDDEPEPVPKTGSKPVCTLPNCDKKGDKSCKNKRALQEHVVTKHAECYPAACPVDGCPRTDFASFIHVDKHMKKDHLEYAMALYDRDMSITCRFEGCEVRYKARVCYRTHLQKEHRVNQPTVLEHEVPKNHSCYVEGCNTPHKFSSPAEYDTHLIQAHGLHTANQRRIFLKGTASRWVENYAPFIYNARFT